MPRPRGMSDEQLITILNYLADGLDRQRVLAALNKKGKIPNNTLGRWLEYLENEAGLIIRIPKSRPQMYELTYAGRQRLKNLRNSITLAHPHIMESQKCLYSLENYRAKYPVIKKGEIWMPKEIDMQNWIQRIDNWKDCNIRLNEKKDGTPISLTIEPLALMGEEKGRLLIRARSICDAGARLLQEQFGFVLGTPEINAGVIELADVMTKALHQEYGYVKGKLDASKLDGELNFKAEDPEELAGKVQAWEDIPAQQSQIKKELMYMREQNELLLGTVTQLVIEQRKTNQALNKLVSGDKDEKGDAKDLPDTEPGAMFA